MRPQVSSLPAERRWAAGCIIFSSCFNPKLEKRVSVYLLSMWAGRAHEEIFSSVGWYTQYVWFEIDIEPPACTVSTGLEGQSGSLFS